MRGRICDLVVYYLKEGDLEKVFCFVELKGKRIDDALEQILDTFEALKGSSEHSERIKWKAYILIGGASPANLIHGSKKF